ncbi:hypothetical protein [Haloarcula halophila]|uniref:hypothetical protein n=1 Tax=Haloarcula TaxID=2237 RepID=UPI0023E36B5D|nr:hypothetical protein [Halomicroarcula sp. DFY41]
MAGDWNAPTDEFSGDVRLQHREETIGLRGAEDVYVRGDAVDGELAFLDAEYVFTDVAVEGSPSLGGSDVDTAVTGNLEDGYVDDVTDDVVITEIEDAFVQYGGAEQVTAGGVEQVFHDDSAAPTKAPEQYEVTVNGWNHTKEATDPRDGVSVVGAKNEVTIREATHDLTVYVVGWDNEVRIEGRNADVTVFFVGRDNTVSVGPYLSQSLAAESGFDNAVDADPLPPEAVIQTSKSEAHSDAVFGRHKLTWQEPATDKDWCPNCGSNADAVIERKQRDALFLLKVPVRTYDDGGISYECEHCSHHAPGHVSLSEDERRDALE